MPNYTEKQSDGTYVTYTEQEWQNKNAGMGWLLIIGFIVFVAWAIWTTFINLGNFSTIPHYGFDLYIKNITHLHKDGYIQVKRPLYLFAERTTDINAESGNGALTLLQDSQLLRDKGHISSSASTWLAVEAFNGSQPVWGWVWGPGKAEDGGGAWSRIKDSELDSSLTQQISNNLQHSRIDLVRVADGLELEKANQDTQFMSKYSKVDSWQKETDKGYTVFVNKKQLPLFNEIVKETKNKDALITLPIVRSPEKNKDTHNQDMVVQGDVAKPEVNMPAISLVQNEKASNLPPINTGSINVSIGPNSASPLLVEMLRNYSNPIELVDLKSRVDDLGLRPEKGDVRASRLLNDQGLAAFKAGLFNEASNYFLESIKANPADIEALNNYGYAQLKSDHFPVAENALGRLLAIAPGRTSGWANLGELYANTSRPDAAVAAFVVGFQFSTNKQMALDFLKSTSLNSDTSSQLKVVIERVLAELSR